MTVLEVINKTICMLSSIEIPAALVRKIGIPISESIRNLYACADALQRPDDGREEQEAGGTNDGEH